MLKRPYYLDSIVRVGLLVSLSLILSTQAQGQAQTQSFDIDVKALVEKLKGEAENESNKLQVPGYSEHSMESVSNKMNSIDPGALNDEGVKVREQEIARDDQGMMSTIDKASSLRRLSVKEMEFGYKGPNQPNSIYETSDKIMEDPVKAFNEMNSQSCKELSSDKRKGYVKKEFTETVIERVKESESCEKPKGNFSCEKSLTVSCSNVEACDYKAIELLPAPQGTKFEQVKDTINIANFNSTPRRYSFKCTSYEDNFNFKISNLKLINEFKLSRIKFRDYLQLTLNGHSVYMWPSGKHGLMMVDSSGKQMSQFTTMVIYNGKEYYPCTELGEAVKVYDNKVDINLMPYLKEGDNNLILKNLGFGPIFAKLQIHMKKQFLPCCAANNWREEWLSDCRQVM